MATPEQARNTALKLIGQAAEVLESVDDRAAAVRTRHTLASIRYDADYPQPGDEMRIPLSLMRMALALMDKDGNGCTPAGCLLQHAIDHARGATTPASAEEMDARLLEIVEWPERANAKLGR